MTFNVNSNRLSVSPVGRAVAQSVLHPRSANHLIEFSCHKVEKLTHLCDDVSTEEILHYVLLHAAYSSDEYSVSGNARAIPYQLGHLVTNSHADEANNYLFERPWQRNPAAANAALLGLRWIQGNPRNTLAEEFPSIGSGVLQNLLREGSEILFAWASCLAAATSSSTLDADRPVVLGDNRELIVAVRSLAAVIREQARVVAVGSPGEVAWMAGLVANPPGGRNRPILSRSAIVALWKHGLTDPQELLRRDTFPKIVEALKPLGLRNLHDVAVSFRSAVELYRQGHRKRRWNIAIERAPANVKAILQDMPATRESSFEDKVESLLHAVGIVFDRLDDGTIAGAPDYRVGLNHRVQVVLELKTAQAEGTIGLNEATDVVKGAAIVDLNHLPMATLANPGFDPNVPWQARNVRGLALVEACEFAFGISLLAQGEIDKETFLGWLAQPGVNSCPVI